METKQTFTLQLDHMFVYSPLCMQFSKNMTFYGTIANTRLQSRTTSDCMHMQSLSLSIKDT